MVHQNSILKLNTIKELYNLQKHYLLKLLENIPNEELFHGQENGVSSPGWVLGHLVVELEDIINHLNLNVQPLPEYWLESFKGGNNWNNRPLKKLPNKPTLIKIFENRYDVLMNEYLRLDDKVREESHPSKIFSEVYSNIDSWFAHHLITHLAIHSGNITAWKQNKGMIVNGF